MNTFTQILIAASLLISSSLADGKADLDDILVQVDSVRNPADSYEMTSQVTSSDSDDVFVFQVSLKGNSKTLIETLKPASSAGKKYLMLQENMWAYTPKMGRPARVSLSQKLTGLAANGDIGRMRWAGDYVPKLEKEDAKSWQLLLTSNKPDLTYDKLRIWVAKGNYHPIKAEFLTPKGQILKTATYGAYKNLLGKPRPTEIIITDANNTSRTSTITVLNIKARDFPESLFNQNALK